MKNRQGRGPRRAPPEPSRAGPSLAGASLVLVVAVGVAVAATVRAAPRPAAPDRLPPFDPGPLTGLRPTGEAARVPLPGAVLYVDDECPYCAVELDRWSRAARQTGSLPTVVVSRRSDGSGRHVPAALRRTMLHDADGSIGRALGVRAVPFLAFLDTAGTVVAVSVGAFRGAERRSLPTSTHPPEIPPR